MLGWEEKSQADDMMIRSTLYPHTPLTLPTHTKYHKRCYVQSQYSERC